MARPGVRRCDVNNDCFNCPYPDCISGEPIVKEEIEQEDIKPSTLIYRKYFGNDVARLNNIKRCREYKAKNKEKVYAKNLEWQQNHEEDVAKIKRKYLRKKAIEAGTIKFYGTIRYKGFEAFVYRTRYGGKFNYFGFLGKEYFEIDEKDVVLI